jgi:hypothetical protein
MLRAHQQAYYGRTFVNPSGDTGWYSIFSFPTNFLLFISLFTWLIQKSWL